jgi:flagellar hook assembly protein FlgD
MSWGETVTSVPLPAADAADFALHPPVPNPFTGRTALVVSVPAAVPLSIRVHSVTGRVVRELQRGSTYAAGLHEIVWDGRDDRGRVVASGVYYCVLEAGRFRQTRAMLLLR